MIRIANAVLLLAAMAAGAIAQGAPSPRQCLAAETNLAAVTVTHAAKEYRLASEVCREQFLSDPERYSQLYDALIELQANGIPIAAPSGPSLVPS